MWLLLDAIWVSFLDMFRNRNIIVEEVTPAPVDGLQLTNMLDAESKELAYPSNKLEVN